jgi:O-antigen/teichoic acid export membrane protein
MASVIERVVRGGAGFFAANLITRGLGFAFIVVASRLLGPAEFGLLALALSVFGVTRKVATFGLPNTIQRFFSGYGEDNIERIYGAVAVIGAAGAGITTVCVYGFGFEVSTSFFREPKLVGPLRVLAIALTAAVSFEILRALLQAQEKVLDVLWVDLIRSSGKLLALVAFVSLGAATAEAGAWAVLAAFGVASLFALRKVQALSIRPTFAGLRPHLRQVVKYTAPLLLVGFSYFLAQQADRLMLGWLADTRQVGVYTATSTLAMIMSTLHGALVSIFMPLASEAYRDGEMSRVRDAYVFISRWMGIVNGGALIAFAGIGGWMLALFGPEYTTQTTYHVLVILSTLYFFGTWAGPTGALLQMTNGHRVELVNTIVFVVINIGLNYVLIPVYGLVGAALATLFSGLTRNVIQLVEIRYWHSISPLEQRNFIVLLLTSVLTAGCFFSDAVWLRTPIAAVGIVIILGFALYSSTKNERKAIRDLILHRTGT